MIVTYFLLLQNWLVRSLSEVEQNVVSVERILHYTHLEPEAPAEIADAIPEQWPTEGEVEFRNYSTRYRAELDLVLRDISIKIVRIAYASLVSYGLICRQVVASQGENWYLRTDGKWQVIGKTVLCSC